jgi:hypothetical protein
MMMEKGINSNELRELPFHSEVAGSKTKTKLSPQIGPGIHVPDRIIPFCTAEVTLFLINQHIMIKYL